jgi:ubiquinone biosynthesis protein UbiJ
VKLGDLDKAEGIELQVKLKDGRTFSEYIARALGEPYRPMPRNVLITKFMEQIEFSRMVTSKNTEKLITLLERLEEVDDIREITKLAAKR